MNSSRLLILAKESDHLRELKAGLIPRGYTCTIIYNESALASVGSFDLLLLEPGDWLNNHELKRLIQRFRQEWDIPVFLLADQETLPEIETESGVQDFALKPYNIDEITVRINRLLVNNTPKEESSEILKAGDIVVDIPRCEVWVRGKIVDLTFTEYELLKFLVSKKGQVLTREVLLNKIWGYDYFGGDRTVDVHITRLRSKIEDPSHSLIETVRNIGYRIKANDK